MMESQANYAETAKARPLCPLLLLAGAINEAAYSTTSTMECIEGACAWWVPQGLTGATGRCGIVR